jgi:predicted amidohydrolase
MQLVAIQLDIAWEDRERNHTRVRELLAGADVRPGALVVLPEMFDTGFSMNTAYTDPGVTSTSESSCQALAAEHKVAVLAGLVARTKEGQLANEAVVFSPSGTELARYRKIHPFTGGGEHKHYCAGTRHCVFEWGGFRIAPFICYDLRFPELFRPAARDGAELIVVVAIWPEKRSEHWVRLLQARAIENQAFVLGVNRTGTDPSFAYDGRSCLFDPHGKEIFQADRAEQVITAEIDPAVAMQWRAEFPALRDITL